jgi:D-arabinose 1-dehydrogenase-like Zn-dependent alcohol dehydrogenase
MEGCVVMTVRGYTVDGGGLRLLTRPVQALAPGQVLVEITAAGVCGTDLKALAPGSSLLHRTSGFFAGHEGVGTVVAVGDEVSWLVAGDEVLLYSYEGCLACFDCLRGEPKFCPETRATSVGRDGTWATHMVTAAESCRRLPDGFDAIDGAVLACTGGAAAAAVGKTGAIPGDRALVVGLGPLGSAVAQLLTGIGMIVHAAEPNKARLAHAREQGWIVGPAVGTDFPVVVETSGSQAGRSAAVGSAGADATVVFVGLGAAAVDLAIDATIRRQLTLRGSHFWTLGAFDDIVALYRRAGVRPRSLVTRTYPFDEAANACRDALTAPGKFVLTFGR